MSEWQPIETAPRVEDEELFVCSYEEGGLYFCDVVTWVSWGDDGCGGWFNGDLSHSADHYTHWMPRPAPPGTYVRYKLRDGQWISWREMRPANQ